MLPIIHQVSGSILLIVGFILLPLPIPLGLPMVTIGFALLAPYVPVVQRMLRRMRGKWPAINETLIRYRDRMPPIIKKTIDKTHPTNTPAE